MNPQFRIDRREGYWTVDVYCAPGPQDWLGGFEEPFKDDVYQKMSVWCERTFKTWLTPRRARRMSYTQFWFKRKKDLDWFILHWSGVDFSDE